MVSRSRPFRTGTVNLSTSRVATETYETTDFSFTGLLGGIGLAAKVFLNEMPAQTDPLGEDNILGFCTGLLSGTNIPFSGRFTIVGKSPLTGTWGESNVGGKFGPELRRAGWDILFFKGRAPELSIVTVMDDEIAIIPAPELQGLDCVETEGQLKEKYGRRAEAATIGLAGEKKVLISGIVTDRGRIAARSGMGAVMGAKNLKAVVVRGTKKITVAKPDKLKELRTFVNKRIKKGPNFLLRPGLRAATRFAPWLRRLGVKNYGSLGPNTLVMETYKRWGTSAGTAILVETGGCTVKNWQGSHKDFPLSKSIELTSDNVTQYQSKRYACHSCPLACGGIVHYHDERYTIPESHRPEFETLAMLGPNILNEDLGAIIKLNDDCNRQGLDTIAVGSLLGFVIEALEKGILGNDDLGGLSPSWGSPDDLVDLVGLITRREGIGNILADGVGRAAAHFGGEELAVHIRNQAFPAHDPRFNRLQLLSYKLAAAPGRHNPFQELYVDMSRFDDMFPELDRDHRVPNFYCYHQTISSLGICQFGLLMGHYPALEFTNLTTGLNLSIEEFITVGERITTLKHMFNLREEINPLDSPVPSRLMSPTLSGPNRKSFLTEDGLYDRFLERLRWDPTTSHPDPDHIRELGLDKMLLDI
ncbi:MAG: aldehyde ferredoxin oxidoreductase family protein [Candidatus Thorarchaeota archaeon]